MNMEQVKANNRRSILNTINANGSMSRKDIAVATGLTPAAVTLLCNELIDEGLVIEKGTVSDNKRAGRRKILLEINYDEYIVIGVTIESEDTVVVMSNLKGDLVDKKVFKTDSDMMPGKHLAIVSDLIEEMKSNHPREARKIKGGCVAISGIVNKDAKTSEHAYGVWHKEVKVCEILEKNTGIPFVIENNVDAFAMAELLFGIGVSYDNLLVLKWGPGVGSTIVTNKTIYQGRNGRAAELGHFIVEPNGRQCDCGRKGCLETMVSYKTMSEKKSFLPEEFGEVYEDFQDELELFARTIVNSMTILAPNRVILSGKMFADERVRKTFIDKCKSYDSKYDEGRILYSTLVDKEEYIGSIAAFCQNTIF